MVDPSAGISKVLMIEEAPLSSPLYNKATVLSSTLTKEFAKPSLVSCSNFLTCVMVFPSADTLIVVIKPSSLRPL